MKIVTIDWNKKLIEEIETDSVRYEEDGISFTYWISPGHIKSIQKIPYNQFLEVKEIN